MRLVRSIALCLGLVALGSPAFAQNRDDTAAVQYGAAIARGHGAVMGRDYAGALAAYREAANLQANKGAAHYYIACVLRMQNDVAGAIAAFETAARLAASGEDDIRARAQMNLSFLREKEQRDQARRGWGEYVQFCDGHAQTPTYPNTARGRIEAIDKVEQVDREYAPVRERIANRVRENAASAGGGGRR